MRYPEVAYPTWRLVRYQIPENSSSSASVQVTRDTEEVVLEKTYWVLARPLPADLFKRVETDLCNSPERYIWVLQSGVNGRWHDHAILPLPEQAPDVHRYLGHGPFCQSCGYFPFYWERRGPFCMCTFNIVQEAWIADRNDARRRHG